MYLKYLKQKLHNTHFVSLFANVLSVGIGVVSYLLLCRVLSIKERGVWLLFQSIFLLMENMRAGFLTTGFIKFYSGVSALKARQVAGSAWYIALLITAFLCLLSIPCYFLANQVDDAGVTYFLIWFSPFMVASLPYFMTNCLLQANQRFDRLLKLKLINNISFILGFMTFYFVGENSVLFIIYAYLLSFSVSGLFALFAGWTQLRDFRFRNKADILELYHFGKYTVGTTISFNLFRTIENFIINFMLGPAALAICDIGVKLLELMEIPLRGLAASGMPILSASYNQKNPDKVIKTTKQLIGVLTILMIPVVALAVVFAHPIIGLIGGGKYVDTAAVNLFRVFIVVALLNPADRFMALTLDAVHKPQLNFIKVLVMMVVLALSDYLGIYLAGDIFGIAYASIFPVLTSILFSYYALQSYRSFGFWGIYRIGYGEIIGQVKKFAQANKG